jgi:hypothetical protein
MTANHRKQLIRAQGIQRDPAGGGLPGGGADDCDGRAGKHAPQGKEAADKSPSMVDSRAFAVVFTKQMTRIVIAIVQHNHMSARHMLQHVLKEW